MLEILDDCHMQIHVNAHASIMLKVVVVDINGGIFFNLKTIAYGKLAMTKSWIILFGFRIPWKFELENKA